TPGPCSNRATGPCGCGCGGSERSRPSFWLSSTASRRGPRRGC
ncbi:MAG: hypothetical protein AVDCRST_MAG20-2486, partial [uncultured Acidimicrobiales bacterium]